MEARLNPYGNDVGMSFAKALTAAHKPVCGSTLPPGTIELVQIRASQINGCGYCTDMHTKDALHKGETQQRLNLIAAWREATVFTDAERAALELAEQGTRFADGGDVTDDAWLNAAKHYDDEQLAALVAAVALINAFNRFVTISRMPAGNYQPGQHA